MSETVIRCPKCGVKMRVTLTPILSQPSDAGAVREIQFAPVSEPKVELEGKPINWKPWRRGVGEWASTLDATELFARIQRAGGRLEESGHQYWIFGRNQDMIARKRV